MPRIRTTSATTIVRRVAGVWLSVSGVKESAGLTDETLLGAIHDQLNKKFGDKGARVVEDNLRVVKRGFVELFEVPHGSLTAKPGDRNPTDEPPLPENGVFELGWSEIPAMGLLTWRWNSGLSHWEWSTPC